MEARFIISAARPDQFPNGDGPALPEVAFLGRSNVGKSSLLNALIGTPGLAFTSSRPGCTQLINFYRVGDAMVSLKHGNYIINAGKAKSKDFTELIAKIQKAVFDATGIVLEPEVRIIEKS